eukprot:1186835-Prorocentrum_minimum.AAC.2
MLAGPKGREVGAPAGNWTQGEKRGRETRGVECILAVIGTAGPVLPLVFGTAGARVRKTGGRCVS